MTDPLSFVIAVLAGTIRSATPVLYATVGECITERSGIINLGLEGIMLTGALTAVVVSYETGSVAAGLAAALVAGVALGLLHAILCIEFKANQIATGIAVTMLGCGLTAFFGASYVGKTISGVDNIKLPGLSDLPIAGPIFFDHDPLVYFTYALIPAAAFLIYRTRFGLSLRAVGMEPEAAASAGISVRRIRYLATACGAALAALGGAYLSLVYAQGWLENMTVGRGWIAVGLVMFAAWSPWRALLGAYLFGGAISLQLRMQAAGADVSPYLLGMVPYLVVIAVLVMSARASRKARSEYPTALGMAYSEQT